MSLELTLPTHARVVLNRLFADVDPKYLGTSLLGLALPGGWFVDVGWYPPYDNAGAYHVTRYRHQWGNREQSVVTTDLAEVVAAVVRLAKVENE